MGWSKIPIVLFAKNYRTSVFSYSFIVFLTLGSFTANHAWGALRCDELAGNPYDSQKVTRGVAWDNLNGPAAVDACLLDIQTSEMMFGEAIPRHVYQLGRALLKNGQIPQGLNKIRAAADDLRYPFAQYSIGRFYKFGEYFQQNFYESMRYYRMAAENGDREAMFDIGASYQDGVGVPSDTSEALKWYQMSLNHGKQFLDIEWEMVRNAERGLNGDGNIPYSSEFRGSSTAPKRPCLSRAERADPSSYNCY